MAHESGETATVKPASRVKRMAEGLAFVAG